MKNTCKNKQYYAYMAVLPKGYYFDGDNKKAIPKEQFYPSMKMKYINGETPIICMPDGTIHRVTSYYGYYFNEEEIDRDTIMENSLLVENGKVTNKKYKGIGNFAMPWKQILYKDTDKEYEVKYENGYFYVRNTDKGNGYTKYTPSMFKTIFNNKGFEKELEGVGLLEYEPEPLFEIRNSGDSDFADRIMCKLSALLDKSFTKLTLGQIPIAKRKDENTVIICNSFEVIKRGETYRLKEKGEIIIETDNEKEFLNYVVAIFGYFPDALLTNFIQQPLTGEEYSCLQQYTTSEYELIQDYLRHDAENPFLNFSHYIKAVKIHEILQKSHPYTNIYLFRGLSVSKSKLKQGYVLSDEGFKSTSFQFEVGTEFMDTIEERQGVLCIINCKSYTKSLYIQGVSDVNEYETLIDINYDLKFIKQLGTYDGTPVWLTETVRNKKEIDNYLYQPDCLEKVMNIIYSDNRIKNMYYIYDISDENTITLKQIYNDNNEVYITISENSITIASSGHKPIYLKMNNENIESAIIQALYNCKKENNLEEEDIKKMNQRISQNLISLLLANNLVIKSQIVGKKETMIQLYVDSYNNKNDIEILTLTIHFRVDQDKVYISFDCNKNGDLRKSKELQVTSENIDKFGQSIYDYLMHYYTLNYERRLMHIVKLIGGYALKDSNVERYNNGYKLEIGDKLVIINKVGNNLRANNLIFNYADDIYTIADQIRKEIGLT